MKTGHNCRWAIPALAVCMAYVVVLRCVAGETLSRADSMSSANLLSHDNLFAWQVSIDSKARTPEEGAQMLERLGLKQLAMSWDNKDVPAFDEQIETFKRHGITILAWIVNDVDSPTQPVDWKTEKNQGVKNAAVSVGELLEMFKRHQIAPQLWLRRFPRESKSVPPIGKPFPLTPFSEWTDEERNRAFRRTLGYDLTTTPQEYSLRVRQEAGHVQTLAKLAAPYGIKIGLYKHGGWIGIASNQVAVIERLKTLGISNVGIVYQFVHAHDEVDDTSNFSAIWKKMQPHVLAVNITGLRATAETSIWPIFYPGQGNLELGMIRAIEISGWKGPVGISPEKGGDAEINLRNNLIGVDWIASQLRHSGSGAPPIFYLPPVN